MRFPTFDLFGMIYYSFTDPGDFTNSSTDPDGDTLTYDWDFGDGNTSTQKNPTHTYPGHEPTGDSWDVTLTVSDGEASDSITRSHSATCGEISGPESCRTVDIDDYFTCSTSDSGDPNNDCPDGSYPGDSDDFYHDQERSYTIETASYLNAGEYLDSIDYLLSAEVSLNIVDTDGDVYQTTPPSTCYDEEGITNCEFDLIAGVSPAPDSEFYTSYRNIEAHMDEDSSNSSSWDGVAVEHDLTEATSDEIELDFQNFASVGNLNDYRTGYGGWTNNERYYGVAKARVHSIDLTICSSNGGGELEPPVAENDGTPPSGPITIEFESNTTISVLNNDHDPDGATGDPYQDLWIISASSDSSGSSVSITSDDKYLRYNPGSLDPGDEDEIEYTIEDADGLTDTGTVYVKIGSVGNVTVTFADADIAGEEGVSITPAYDANNDGSFSVAERLGPLNPGMAADTGWNVPLYEEARVFAIEREDIDLPEGYELPEADTVNWILKEVPVDDFTGQQNTAELGLSYTEDGGGGDPGDPDPPSCRTVDVASADIDAYALAARGRTETDSANSSITFADYVDSGEYVSEVTHTASVSAEIRGDCAGGEPGCEASASATGGVEAETPPDDLDSDTQTITRTYDPSDSDTDASFSVNVFTSSGTDHVHGGIASASIEDILLEICES